MNFCCGDDTQVMDMRLIISVMIISILGFC